MAIIQNEDLKNSFEKAMSGFVGWINIVGLTAMVTAYSKCDPWLVELLTVLESNRDYVYRRINDIDGLSMIKPEGTYLAWIKSDLKLNDETPSDFFFNHARVALNDGQWFGENGKNYVRLNFGTTKSVLEEAIDRMEHAISQLK